MRQKVLAILLIVFLALNKSVIVYANNADEYIEENSENDENYEEDDELSIEEIQNEIVQTSAKEFSNLNINSKSAIVIDRESKRILYSKNINEKCAMASTTKIMTCIIALESAKLDEIIIVSKEAAMVGGSTIGLSTGDKITMIDLIYGLMLCSGNDAAMQIAITLGNDTEGFSKIMNKKAKEIGLINTNFVTPHGLDDINHYTTAFELAILTDYALTNKQFAQIVNTKSKNITINGKTVNISNTNELLGYLNGVNGVKTGYTSKAGRCLVISCKRNNMNLISVVLGADTKKDRTRDSIRILEYAFKNYSQIDLKSKIEKYFKEWKSNNGIEIIKGKEDIIQPYLEPIPYVNYPILKEEENIININIECEKVLTSPIIKKTHVGKLTVKIDNNIILELELMAPYTVYKKEPIDYLHIIWENVHRAFSFAIL